MTIAGYRTALCREDDPSWYRDCRGWSPSDVRSAQADAAAAPAKAKAAADADMHSDLPLSDRELTKVEKGR
jgi:hypothetical protein